VRGLYERPLEDEHARRRISGRSGRLLARSDHEPGTSTHYEESVTHKFEVILVGLGFIAVMSCGETGTPDQASGETSTGPDEGNEDDDGSPMVPPPPATDCIPGSEECSCLESECAGSLFCVEQICKPGPQLGIPDRLAVLAGVRIPIAAEIDATSFEWSQIRGPAATLIGTDQTTLLVDVPTPLAAGQTLTLRLEAELNTIVESRDLVIEILDAVFVDAFDDPEAEPPPPLVILDAPTGLDFALGSMWITLTGGAIVRVDDNGTVGTRFDVSGSPMSAVSGRIFDGMDNLDVLFFADSTLGAARSLQLQGGRVELLTDRTEAGDTLGAIEFVLPRGNGDLILSNGDAGQLFLHSLDDGVTRLLFDGFGASPSAMTFGPEEGVLYVGTLGQVHRVPILPDDTVVDASVYLDFGASDDPNARVDGLVFDDGLNLWLGSQGSQTLVLARYEASGSTEVVRRFTDAGEGLSDFAELHFGANGFDRNSLYYVNPTSGRIGRLSVGD